ncbi:hypothetical protein HK104_010179 [Borealophlyctis nickersoniae]|nr:hypothetical protein HK104_010179 [Borealophlyctis nickersoniae]
MSYPDGPKILQAVSVCPGAQYRLSFALKNIGASATSRPTIVTDVVSGVKVAQSTPLTVDQGWVVFEGLWTADLFSSGDAVVMVTASNDFDGSGGTVWSYLWMDQVTLTKI